MRRLVSLIFVSLFAFIFAGCGESSEQDYDAAVRNAFLENCQYEGGDLSYCSASLECIEGKLTQEEFLYEENWLILRGELSDRLTEVMAVCLNP